MKKLLLLLVSISIPILSPALMISPNQFFFIPEKDKTAGRLTVDNDSDEILPLEFYIVKRSITENGDPIYDTNLEEEDFVIFPEQMLLEPGEKQTVQINYTGDPSPTIEHAYALMSEVLPVPTASLDEDERSSLNLSVRYASMLYVRPTNQEAKLSTELSFVELEKDEEQMSMLGITISNNGLIHARLVDPVLAIKWGENNELKLNKDELTPLDQTILLAKAKRSYLIPWPQQIPRDAAATGKIYYKKDVVIP